MKKINYNKIIKGSNMTWLYALIGGLVLGSGGSAAFFLLKKKPDEPVEQVAKEQIEVQKNLTEPDLLEVPCSQAYIDLKGQDLCREMFCRMTTRGIDAKTSGAECEEISNLINSKAMLKACSDLQEDEQRECYDLFFRRK
jgi:hypothetical protein